MAFSVQSCVAEFWGKFPLLALHANGRRGLFLLVNPSGSRLWRFKFRFAGKKKCLAFGKYPDVSIKLARERRDRAREQLTLGDNPGQHMQADEQQSMLSAWRSGDRADAAGGLTSCFYPFTFNWS